MKAFIQKCIGKVFRIFQIHTILKLAGLLIIIYLLSLGIKWIPTLQIKYSKPPTVGMEELSVSQGEIAVDAMESLVAETESKKLYIDPVTLNLKVEDKATRKTWSSIHPNGSEQEKSLIDVTYVGKDNNFYTWDSFTYAIKNQTYTIDQIDDGVRINLQIMEADSNRINEYIPQKITIEKYEATFIKGLADKAAEGEITQDEFDKYQTALSLIYAKDEVNNCYYNRHSNAPPLSVIKQLIAITKILHYTTDQLMEDNSDFGISIEIVEPANFIIPIEAVLDENDFVVRIPTNQIQNKNKYYTLTHIEVFPYFGSVGPNEVADGYILVPDGSGALLELNKFNSNYGSYYRELYSNNYLNSYYFASSYPENLNMPVFGMTYGKGKESTGGFMGIIEQGDETAYIRASLASTDKDGGGSAYNKVNSSFDSTQYAQVSILGPYDSEGGGFISSTGMMNIDYTVRYKLFPETVTYFDMAKSYRDYLINRFNLTVHYDERAKLYLDVIGSLTLEKRILGLPYHTVVSMTSYNDLKGILSDLQDIPIAVNYLGMFNDGLDHKIMNRADLTKANGTKKQLNDLMSFAENNHQELYFQADFSKIYEKGNGFQAKTHGIYNFYDNPVDIYGYYYPTASMWDLTPSYHILNPVYLNSVVDGFLNKAEDYKHLYIGDLASNYYANYKSQSIVSPAQGRAIVNANLEKLAEKKTLSLNNPQMNEIIYGKYATNISRESSGYGGFAEEIPFRQLVMNGLIAYTTLDVNETGTSSDYFLLQALELGSYPKFVVTAKNLDILKNSVYSDFISRQYSTIVKDMKALYQQYEDAYSQINSMEITNHEILAEQVFETTYANGVKVITNYNKYSVDVNGQEVGALGYGIIQ